MADEKQVTLQARIPKALAEELDDQARSLGVTRAAMMRMLLATALGDDVQVAVLRETYYRISPIIRRVMPRALQRAYEVIPDLIQQEFDSIDESEWNAPPAVNDAAE